MIDPSHQAIVDRLHQEARCLPWRHQLIADRLQELEDLEHATELALVDYADNDAVRAGVLHLRELIDKAGELHTQGELDYAEIACERVEHALIELRMIARSIGAAP
jgi:hypothetical protein